jgi:hypothetical protein
MRSAGTPLFERLRDYGDTILPVCVGFSSIRAMRSPAVAGALAFLAPQAALHEAFKRHEVIRAERTSGCFRGPRARQRYCLQLRVDERGDVAEPFEERRDSNEAIIAPARMRATGIHRLARCRWNAACFGSPPAH